MPSWITLALGIVKEALSLLGLWKAEVHDVQQKNVGKAEVAVVEAKHIEEARKDRDAEDKAVHARPDAELDKSLDKWMRD